MKTQLKLIILISCMAGLFLLGLVMIRHLNSERAETIAQGQAEEKARLLETVIELEGRPTQTFAYNYSFWDDMVNFVHHPDSNWVSSNLDVGLNTFRANAVWVLRKDFTQVYHASNLDSCNFVKMPLSVTELERVLSQESFCHFYLMHDDTLLEIFGAPIQPSRDHLRVTAPHGFFLVGKSLNGTYIKSLEDFTESKISVIPSDSGAVSENARYNHAGAIRFAKALLDNEGKSIARIEGSGESLTIKELDRSSNRNFYILVAFTGIISASIFVMLIRWIWLPLRQLTASLKLGDESPIERLKLRDNEFGQLARLITHYYRQNEELEQEIVVRAKAENDSLEMAGKLAVLADEQKVLLENARDFIYRHDVNGVFFYTSPSVFQTTGYTSDEWGTHYTKYLTDNPINKEVVEFTEDTLKSGRPHPPYLVEIYHKDGRRVLLEANEQPYFENGKVSGIVGVARDVTQRKQIEERLRESDDKYRYLIENISDGVVILDLEQKVVFANCTACNIFGYTAEELQKISLKDIVVEDHLREMMREMVQRRVGLKGRLEMTIRRKDGELRTVSVAGKPHFDITGKVIGSLGVFSDVTEAHKAEEEKRKLSEKLEHAKKMESLAVLAGGVAHDLNNILGPLVAYPEMILMSLGPDSPIKKKVEMIGRSAREAADVIQDLLSLARRGRYEMTGLNFNDVVEEYLGSPSYQSLLSRNPNIFVEVSLERQIGYISGSASHLLKVIMNLVINAFDAMPNGGRLLIETRQEYLESLRGGFNKIPAGEYAIFRIKDTGIGIYAADLRKIFEPYYSKKKMGSSGSGLGLSVVYGTVKDHKGFYDVLSKVGAGTEFILYFPIVPKTDDVKEPETVDFSGKESILVIDDIWEQREVTMMLAAGLGYKTATVSSGREAVVYLKSHDIDLVIIDMILEKDYDGCDTYREILRSKPVQKAIITSGFSVTERVEMMQKMGAGQFVPKPFNQETLGRAIREELNRSMDEKMSGYPQSVSK